MRKGYTILEMVGVVSIAGLLLIVTAGPFRKVTYEIPGMNRDFNANTSLCHAAERIRRDVESASAVMSYPGNESVVGPTLLIQTDLGAVLYYTADGVIVRQVQQDGTEETWDVPKGRLRWKLWYSEDGEEAEAVEVTHAIARKIAGKVRQRLVNTHVFFVGSDAENGGKS